MLAGINQPTAQDHIDHAIECLNMARKADDQVAPVVGRAIDILKGTCGDSTNQDDEEGEGENSPMSGPSSNSKPY